MTFVVTTESRNTLNLRALVKEFADNQWIPAHYTPEQATDVVLDQFKKAIATELELIEVKCDA